MAAQRVNKWPWVNVPHRVVAIDENHQPDPIDNTWGFGRIIYRFDNGYGLIANVPHDPSKSWHVGVVLFLGPEHWLDWTTRYTPQEFRNNDGSAFHNVDPRDIADLLVHIEAIPNHSLPEVLRLARYMLDTARP